jgi:hypothetical protein
MAAVTYGAGPAVEIATAKKGKSVLRRFFEAIADARLRQAQREIELHRHLLPAEFEIASHRVNERSEDSLPFVR